MPAFYCENCGKEVPPSVPVCPYCGKKFYSVRCPVCSFSGPAKAFVGGCPACGYQGKEGKSTSPKGKKNYSRHKKEKHDFPRWLYTLFLFVLLGGLVLLIGLYIRL